MTKKTFFNTVAAMGLGAVFMVAGCAPVTISSTPDGASVYHKKSNRLIGQTPATVSLIARDKAVVVRKDGYFPKTVVLSPVDPENVSVELKKREKVLVLSEPSGAELYVDGETRRVGRTPYTIDYDQPYRTFTARAQGHAPQTFTIPEDPEGHVVIKLERTPTVILSTMPTGVEVYDIKGIRLGETPLDVPAEKIAEFELRKEGYYPKTIAVGPDTKSPCLLELEREPVIIVYSEPANALVVHRGVTLGKTPYRHFVKEDMDIELHADRHYTKHLTIAPDSPRDVHVKLDPKPYITVKSTPPGAMLYRSGGVELLGVSPVEILIEDDIALEMHKPGYEIKPFTLSSKSAREVTVPLVTSASGPGKTIFIDSEPSGALVYRLGGAELIGTTPLEQSVRAERTFELQKPGFRTKIVTVAPDSANSVVFALAKDESAGNVAIGDPLLNTPSSF
jgi:hypothetical protein